MGSRTYTTHIHTHCIDPSIHHRDLTVEKGIMPEDFKYTHDVCAGFNLFLDAEHLLLSENGR